MRAKTRVPLRRAAEAPSTTPIWPSRAEGRKQAACSKSHPELAKDLWTLPFLTSAAEDDAGIFSNGTHLDFSAFGACLRPSPAVLPSWIISGVSPFPHRPDGPHPYEN